MVCVKVAVIVDIETSNLPELADDNCSSTIPTADTQTTITITIAATGLVTPALAANDFRPVISSNRLRLSQESDKIYESSVYIRAILSAPPPLPSSPLPTGLLHRAWVGLWNGCFAHDVSNSDYVERRVLGAREDGFFTLAP